MPSAINGIWEFGEFRLDAQTRLLRRGPELVPLTPKAFELLLVLIEGSGQLIAKDELMKAVWPDSFVDESNLTQTIFIVRKMLGESRDRPYIVTVPGRGYRFVATVIKREPTEAVTASSRETVHAEPTAASKRGWLERLERIPWRNVVLGAFVLFLLVGGLLSFSLRPAKSVAATTKTTRLTGDGQTFKAAISPDGRYIAHTSLAAGQESLRVRRTTTLHDIEIVPPQTVRYIGVTFSPDSESIYYVVRTDKTDPPTLYRVAVMGGSSEKLKVRLDSPVTLSPNGKKIAFVRESESESSLIVADLEAGGEHNLLSRKLPRVLDYPAWSPDGQIIACTDTDSAVASTKGSDTRIIEIRVADGTLKPLSAHAWGYIRQLAWMGNGEGLVMSARSQQGGGTFHVWFVSYPDGNERKVTEGLNGQQGASISADSRQIVTVDESSFISSIWRIPVTGSQDPKLVVSGLSGWSPPAWIEKDQIAFEEELNGRESLWTVDTQGGNRKQLTRSGNDYDHSISRNGQKVAWVSDRNGSLAIWAMDIDGGNLALVVQASGESFPQLSPDGKWIAFTVVGAEHWPTLWRVASSGGPAIQLSNRLWQRPVISPDGKWIAGLYADHQLSTQKFPEAIAVIGINGGPLRKIFPIPLSVALSAGVRWSPDGRQLTFVDRGKDGDNVWSFRVSDGSLRQITSLHGVALISFDWSPDGMQLAFSRGGQTRDVALIEDTGQK